jgi:hypothetical protein
MLSSMVRWMQSVPYNGPKKLDSEML